MNILKAAFIQISELAHGMASCGIKAAYFQNVFFFKPASSKSAFCDAVRNIIGLSALKSMPWIKTQRVVSAWTVMKTKQRRIKVWACEFFRKPMHRPTFAFIQHMPVSICTFRKRPKLAFIGLDFQGFNQPLKAFSFSWILTNGHFGSSRTEVSSASLLIRRGRSNYNMGSERMVNA